jgi:hypothetical protein
LEHFTKIFRGDNPRSLFNKSIFCSPEFNSGLQNVSLLNILLELSPLEVFVKCYKLRATKYTFVEQTSGIVSPENFCKVFQTQGYKVALNL